MSDHGQRTLKLLSMAKKDFPLREFLTIVMLILAVWAADTFVASRSYDRNYFVVVEHARREHNHCRDMVVSRPKKNLYKIETCRKRYFFRMNKSRPELVRVEEGEMKEPTRWAN